MTGEERSEAEPKGEEAPYRSPEQVSGKAGDHEMPTTGRAGDLTGDEESLARRPPQDESEIPEDTDSGGTPPGSETRGG